ncbi:MAG TPA: prepilin-type N-terminal cleavage/methylation domain-containing protein [Fimbriiglobus sp.]|jgi:prepilin-type N-terminal cleavage/methylation domain-containing protein
MTLHRTTRRAGFTLLEVLLASAIGVMLLGGLYVAMDLVLREADAGRQEVEKNDTARAVINRLTIDCSGIMGPLPQRSGGGPNSQMAASSTTTDPSAAAGATTGTGTTGATGSTDTTGTTSSTDPTTVDTTDTPFTMATNQPFGCGVVGNDKMLSFFVSRVPKGLSDPNADPTVLQPTDLRRVTYYLGSSGNGLCRQEVPWVTADGTWNATDADRTNEDADVIADDITDVTFEYFDGATWQPSWDGTALNLDQVTILGPPRAIRVTFVISKTDSQGNPVTQQVRHVVPIRTANGLIPVNPPTDTTTTSTGGM